MDRRIKVIENKVEPDNKYTGISVIEGIFDGKGSNRSFNIAPTFVS